MVNGTCDNGGEANNAANIVLFILIFKWPVPGKRTGKINSKGITAEWLSGYNSVTWAPAKLRKTGEEPENVILNFV